MLHWEDKFNLSCLMGGVKMITYPVWVHKTAFLNEPLAYLIPNLIM